MPEALVVHAPISGSVVPCTSGPQAIECTAATGAISGSRMLMYVNDAATGCFAPARIGSDEATGREAGAVWHRSDRIDQPG